MLASLATGTMLAGSGLLSITSAYADTTFVVTNKMDSGEGSLRQAILDANSASGTDDITFASTVTGTITLTSGPLTITDATNIIGPGAQNLTISGNDASRVFVLSPAPPPGALRAVATPTPSHTTISGLTLAHGSGDSSGGGAVRVDGQSLTLDEVAITDSASTGPGGGVFVATGQLQLVRSSVTGNSSDASGGGIAARGIAANPGTYYGSYYLCTSYGYSYEYGEYCKYGYNTISYTVGDSPEVKATVDLFNSTVSGNSTGGNGSEIFGDISSVTTLTSSTVTGTTGGPEAIRLAGGDLYLHDSIVSQPESASVTTTPGYTPYNYNQYSTTYGNDSLVRGVEFNGQRNIDADPKLSDLMVAGNGTSYQLPANDSPVVDADAATEIAPSSTDQIGGARLSGPGLDLGAIELQPPAFTSGDSVSVYVGEPLSYAVTTTGAPAATVTATGVPTGFTFTPGDNGTATITGTPTADQVGTFHVSLTASNGREPDATQDLKINVLPGIAFTSAPATTFTAGSAGTFTVTVTGDPTPTLSESGALPEGITFSPETGALAGTTTQTGTFPLTFTASNGEAPTRTQDFVLTVQAATPPPPPPPPPAPSTTAPAFTSPNSAPFTVGTAGSFTITTSGNPTVSAITETGSLPSGLTYTDNHDGTAKVTGTPAAGTTGSFPVTLTATNGTSPDATQTLTVVVSSTAPPAAKPLSFKLGTHTIAAGQHTKLVVTGPAGDTVTVKRRGGASSTYTTLATLTLNPSGSAFVDISPATNTSYVVSDSKGAVPAQSLTVKAVESLVVSRSGRGVVLSGHVAPSLPGRLVTVYYYVDGDHVRTAGSARTNDGGQFHVSSTLFFPGQTVHFFAETESDALNAAGRSAIHTATFPR